MMLKGFKYIDTFKRYGFEEVELENKHTILNIGIDKNGCCWIKIKNKKRKNMVRSYNKYCIPNKYKDIVDSVLVSYKLLL